MQNGRGHLRDIVLCKPNREMRMTGKEWVAKFSSEKWFHLSSQLVVCAGLRNRNALGHVQKSNGEHTFRNKMVQNNSVTFVFSGLHGRNARGCVKKTYPSMTFGRK